MLPSGFSTHGYKSLNKAAGGLVTKDTKPYRKTVFLVCQNLIHSFKTIYEYIAAVGIEHL
jgi:hypothetical protein